MGWRGAVRVLCVDMSVHGVGEGCWVCFVCRHVNVCVCGRAPVCLRLCVFGVLDNKTVAACLDVVLTRLGL